MLTARDTDMSDIEYTPNWIRNQAAFCKQDHQLRFALGRAADALEQTEKEAACAAHNAAEYHEIIRNQRQHIEQLEAAGQRSLQWLASYPGGCCLGAYQQMTEVLESAGSSNRDCENSWHTGEMSSLHCPSCRDTWKT